jgi:hypothetical protein
LNAKSCLDVQVMQFICMASCSKNSWKSKQRGRDMGGRE